MQIADLIEACLQRDSRARPTAKEIFDTLQELLARPQSKMPPLMESKAETGVAESNLMSTQEQMAAVVTGVF